MSPTFVSSRYRHSTAITATPSTYGAKYTARKRFRPGELAVQHHGDGERDHQEQRCRQQREEQCVAQGLPEDRCPRRAAADQTGVVVQTDERLVRQREVVAVQAHPQAPDDLVDDERHEEHQVGGAEQPPGPASLLLVCFVRTSSCVVGGALPGREESSSSIASSRLVRPNFTALLARIPSARAACSSSASSGERRPSTASLTASSSVWALTSPMPGIDGHVVQVLHLAGQRRLRHLLELGAVARLVVRRDHARAAHMLERSIIHLMKTLLACCASRSGLRCVSITSWCELAHDAGRSKIVGIGASDHFRFLPST